MDARTKRYSREFKKDLKAKIDWYFRYFYPDDEIVSVEIFFFNLADEVNQYSKKHKETTQDIIHDRYIRDLYYYWDTDKKNAKKVDTLDEYLDWLKQNKDQKKRILSTKKRYDESGTETIGIISEIPQNEIKADELLGTISTPEGIVENNSAIPNSNPEDIATSEIVNNNAEPLLDAELISNTYNQNEVDKLKTLNRKYLKLLSACAAILICALIAFMSKKFVWDSRKIIIFSHPHNIDSSVIASMVNKNETSSNGKMKFDTNNKFLYHIMPINKMHRPLNIDSIFSIVQIKSMVQSDKIDSNLRKSKRIPKPATIDKPRRTEGIGYNRGKIKYPIIEQPDVVEYHTTPDTTSYRKSKKKK